MFKSNFSWIYLILIILIIINYHTQNNIIHVIKKPPSSEITIDSYEPEVNIYYDDIDQFLLFGEEHPTGNVWNYILKNFKNKRNKIYLNDKNYIAFVEKSIKLASDNWKVPESLIYAVIQRESNFYPYEVSSKGCYGLMQINYPVWRLAFKLKDPIQLFDPSVNINLGTRLLKHYYEKYGTWKKALYYYFGKSDKASRYQEQVWSLYKHYYSKLKM